LGRTEDGHLVSPEGLEWARRPVVRAVGIATFASLSTILNFGTVYLTFWGMKIDLVAVPWILTWVIFGVEGALLCALISIPMVSFVGLGVTGLVGGTMKFVASVWMFVIPALYVLVRRMNRLSFLHSRIGYIAIAALAIAIRDVVTVFFNIYFALPVFLGLDLDSTVQFFGTQSPFVYWLGITGLSIFIVEIVFWNSIQGIIDMFVSWTVSLAVVVRLIPKSKLKRS